MKGMLKYIFGLLTFLLVAACGNDTSEAAVADHVIQVPDIDWNFEQTFYDQKTSRWRFKSDSNGVSGRIISFFPNGKIAKNISVFNGEKEGDQLTYFLNGRLRFSETYSANKLHGKVMRWGNEGYTLLAELNYVEGKLHGEQKKWYPTGELHKLLQIRNGKEQGIQKAFRKNGALYANYEAKNGRVFGMKRSNLCYELENEQVVYIQ